MMNLNIKEKPNRFKYEEELYTYLGTLADDLTPHHDDDECECDRCLWDSYLICGLWHIADIFESQIFLLRSNRPLIAGLTVRPIVELVIDALYINLDLAARVKSYVEHADSFEIWWLKITQEKLISKDLSKTHTGISLKDLQENIKILEGNLKKNNMNVINNPTQWTNVSLPKRIKAICDKGKYKDIILNSLGNKENIIRYVHSMIHCSGVQVRRGIEYRNDPERLTDKTSVYLTIDWIMIFLEFLKFHFSKPEIENDIKKFHRMFYPEQYK